MHTQLIYAAFVPLGTFLLLEIVNGLARLSDGSSANARRSGSTIIAFSLFSAIWASTAFYSFFFFMIFTLMFVVPLVGIRRRQISTALRNWVRHPSILFTTLLGLAITPLTLWIIYGAAHASTGGHHWPTEFNPRLQDLFNVGPDNLIWSPLLAGVYQALSQRQMTLSEFAVGFPVIFLPGGLILLGLFDCIRPACI